MTTVFPLVKGKIALSSGTITLGANKLVHCEEDGTIDIVWADESTTPGIALVAGSDRSIPDGVGVTIHSGVFSIA